jgi:hyperosmotically inducible periplasmic protein
MCIAAMFCTDICWYCLDNDRIVLYIYHRRLEMKKIFIIPLFLLFGFAFFPGCTSLKGESAGEIIDDATITAQVNGLIVKDLKGQYFKIEVTTIKGDVVLQGFVRNKDDEVFLEEKIREIRGVKSVKSLLRLENK